MTFDVNQLLTEAKDSPQQLEKTLKSLSKLTAEQTVFVTNLEKQLRYRKLFIENKPYYSLYLALQKYSGNEGLNETTDQKSRLSEMWKKRRWTTHSEVVQAGQVHCK